MLLVTGGLGFIGSNFIRYMLSHHPDDKIVNLDLMTYAGNPMNVKDIEQDPRYTFVHGDICDRACLSAVLKKYPVDTIVHFAAESHVDRSISDSSVFVRTNLLGTQVLLEAARAAKIQHFIHISTDEVYGSIETMSFQETAQLNPSSPYSASKAGSDLLVKAYHTTHGFPGIITRCTNNYGPYQYPEKLIPLFITNLLQGKKVPVYGTGNNVRDWIYVLDHCSAIDTILHKGVPGEIYNIASGNEKSNIEITRLLLDLTGGDETMIDYVPDRPGHDWRYSLYSGKLRKLGWIPRFDFNSGLEETVAWYRENEGWWRPLMKRKLPKKF